MEGYFSIFVVIVLVVIIVWLKLRAKKWDPLYGCGMYKDIGCSHIDGPLCDFPYCIMHKEYMNNDKDKKV